MRRSLAVVGAAVLVAAVAVGSRSAHGTAYNPLTTEGGVAEAALAPGATVFLFHGGGAESRGAVRTGDVLGVQRPRQDGQWHVVGTVRVDAEVGALCFRSEVVEGELRLHDVVPAGGGGLLLITSEAPCLFTLSH